MARRVFFFFFVLRRNALEGRHFEVVVLLPLLHPPRLKQPHVSRLCLTAGALLSKTGLGCSGEEVLAVERVLNRVNILPL